MSRSLVELSSHLLVEVLSYITHRSDYINWCGNVCRALKESLNEEAAWRHLCKWYWYATDARLQNWPALSARGLYRALEQWTPAEGYYVLSPAFPWGLLVLLRLTDGCVNADIARFIPRIIGGFEEVLLPLFRVSLSEVCPGVLQSTFMASWLKGANAEISRIDPSQLLARTPDANYFPSRRFVNAQFFQTRRALRIEPAKSTATGGYAETQTPPEVCQSEVWRPGQLLTTAENAAWQTEQMLEDMLGQGQPCDLALIRGPGDFVPHDSSSPIIRPGLYVGDYGHVFYGQFRTEVLLLEYLSVAPETLVAESGIFARPAGETPPRELERLKDVEGPITFMRGVKQCGDIHVPMGATTFVAVCEPAEAQEALAQGQRKPDAVVSRSSQQEEKVLRAWRGFGTLAAQGFRNPSWAGGWLVQLRDAASCDHRFAFVWDRNQEAVVLHWVGLQDSSAFLQRTWLPEDLQ